MYRPTSVDLYWAKNMMALLADGGIMGFPDARLLFKVSHTTKTITLLNPEMLAEEFSKETYDRTVIVFGQIGYKVTGGSP